MFFPYLFFWLFVWVIYLANLFGYYIIGYYLFGYLFAHSVFTYSVLAYSVFAYSVFAYSVFAYPVLAYSVFAYSMFAYSVCLPIPCSPIPYISPISSSLIPYLPITRIIFSSANQFIVDTIHILSRFRFALLICYLFAYIHVRAKILPQDKQFHP